MTNSIFQEYFKEVRKTYLNEEYSELSFRTCFETFIEGLNTNFELHQEGKRIKTLGIPDFKAFRNSAKVGYIETKDINKDLDDELKSDQIKKYANSINNLLLTNYYRFIFIRKNQTIFDLTLFNKSDLNNSNFTLSNAKANEFMKWVTEFFDYKATTIQSAKELANELAKKARLLEQLAKEQLEVDISKTEERSSIYDFYEVLKELIKEITVDECVDAYAQTITYGLFLSKTEYEGDLDRDTAAIHISKSVGVIKKIFENVSGDHLPTSVSWIVDELIDVLNVSDIKKILEEIDFRGKKDRDPFTFFYEDFLNLYDPKKRKHLGVYYTPRPVVSFIVNSINQILKDDFNKLNGFADDDVKVLDPAVGTGTFLWLVYLVTLGELKKGGKGGMIQNKIEEHVLKHFYGFELLITPYIIAHLKLTTVLKKWYYHLKENDRIPVYLTNTLEPTELHGLMLFMKEISEESRIAKRVKEADRILVVLGNPPYSVSSSNKSAWIKERMQDYKKGLNERNIQPLDDDYIKFIRFAHWKIEQNPEGGVLGFITNNSYIDGIIHRQMRKSLLDTFNRIYILNLHGDSGKKETCPDGSKDENVFDIQQGVAIALFVKNDKFKDNKVFYADLYGKRNDKYLELDRHSVNSIGMRELNPQGPYYFFAPKDFALQSEYEKFWKVTDIFKVYGSGIKFRKDNLLTKNHFTKASVLEMLKDMEASGDENIFRKYDFGETKDWTLKDKRQYFLNYDKNDIQKVCYRPFDFRFTYYPLDRIDKIIPRGDSRRNLMQHLMQDNLGLITVRQVAETVFNHSYITDTITEGRITLSKKGMAYIFPLHLYSNTNKKHPNFTNEFLEFIEERYPHQEIEPEDILGYIYAVLHSPTYRQIYEEFLKIDFPRINFVDDYNAFKKLSGIGKELIDLHLMKTRLPTSTKFDTAGSNVVESVKYADGRVHINKEQFFDGVPEDIWNFHVGGYQVLDKWLKSRKGRELDGEDMEHFLQVVEVIKKTIGYMGEIG